MHHALMNRAGAAGTLAVALAASTASASEITFGSDTAFNTYQQSGAFTKTFGGNVRWGNGAGNGDWEYAIVDGNDVPIGGPAQAQWNATNTHDVSFRFDGATATLDLAGVGTLSRAVPGNPTALFARVRDGEAPFSGLRSLAIDLAFNGVGTDYTYDVLLGDPDAQYWGVTDENLRFGFTVTARATLDGPRTSGSDPMYQFKVGVPAPAAGTLLVLGGIAGARRRRRG